MPRKCVNMPNKFCYICGEVTFANQKRSMTQMIKTAYHHYFGVKVGDQDKPWAPHICCITCNVTLREWLNKKGRSMRFAVPMVWREPTNHTDNCYFCMTPPLNQGMSRKKKCDIKYPDIPSAIRPISGDGLPVPSPPQNFNLEEEEENEEEPALEGPIWRPWCFFRTRGSKPAPALPKRAQWLDSGFGPA